jgi:hypothetical protein
MVKVINRGITYHETRNFKDPEAKFILGYIDLSKSGLQVKNADGDNIGIIDSLDDAIPVLLDQYEKHPPQWQEDSVTEFAKFTRFGQLSVGQEPLGFWSVYRNLHDVLLYDGKPAVFRTAEEAKDAADAHMRDELGKLSDDGFEWFSMK